MILFIRSARFHIFSRFQWISLFNKHFAELAKKNLDFSILKKLMETAGKIGCFLWFPQHKI